MSGAVEQWFAGLPEEHNALLQELRKLILARHADIAEEIKWGRPVYSLKQMFCYLHKSKEHVTIGFHNGAQLDDPNGLLEGTGKGMRHVKIGVGDVVDAKAIRRLVAKAVEMDLAGG